MKEKQKPKENSVLQKSINYRKTDKQPLFVEKEVSHDERHNK